MTSTELSREFDLLFNNSVGISAPEIKGYEKSLYFTEAQEIIVKGLYEDLRKGTSVEANERIRRRLQPLTIYKAIAYNAAMNTLLTALKISDNSKLFQIEDDVWYIIGEELYVGSTTLTVKPINMDEYSVQKNNPFKKPNSRKAWRRDVGNNTTYSTFRVVDIITTTTPTKYTYTYIIKPSPIIVEDLAAGEYTGLGLTIDGISDITECVLDSEVQRDILVKAVELATLSYKENTLANNVQLNQNNNF